MISHEFLKWKRCTDEDISRYYYIDPLSSALDEITIPDSHSATKANKDVYYDCIVNGMKPQQRDGIKCKQFIPHAKPFWNRNLKDLHNEMYAHRKQWIEDGKPRGHLSTSY